MGVSSAILHKCSWQWVQCKALGSSVRFQPRLLIPTPACSSSHLNSQYLSSDIICYVPAVSVPMILHLLCACCIGANDNSWEEMGHSGSLCCVLFHPAVLQSCTQLQAQQTRSSPPAHRMSAGNDGLSYDLLCVSSLR